MMFSSKTNKVVAGLLWVHAFAATINAHPQPAEGLAVSNNVLDLGMHSISSFSHHFFSSKPR